MDSNWIEYKCNSGRTLFIYNKGTGEHKWPAKYNHSLQESILYGQPIINKELCSIGTQTDDYGCDNGCSSKYVNAHQSLSKTSEPIAKPEQAATVDNKPRQDNEYTQEINLDAYRENQSIDIHLDVPQDNNFDEQNIIRLEQEVPSMVRVYSEGFVLTPENDAAEKNNDAIGNSPTDNSDEKSVEMQGNDYDTGETSSQQRLDALTCSYCFKSFNCKSKLVSHLRIHTGEKPFECSLCDKKFTRKVNLISHVRQHSGDQPFECPYCDKKFSHKSSLSYHQSTHAVEKPFECVHCEKKFVRRCDLNMHLKTHLGEKPFECSLCQRTFLRKDHLKDHLRTHAGKKPFECSYCHKTFGQKGTLSYHIKTHTGEKPFQCSICTKKFIHRGHLNVHMQMHSGERQFECHLCQMKFSRKGRLNFHLKTHGDEKAV